MEICKINNAQPQFSGKVDRRLLRTMNRAVKQMEKEYQGKPSHTEREKVFFDYYKRVVSDIQSYMKQFDEKTVLKLVPADKKDSYTLSITNTDLGTKLGFNLLTHIQAPLVKDQVNVSAPTITKKESGVSIMRKMRYFTDNIKRLNPELIDESMYQTSKNSGYLRNSRSNIEVLDDNIIFPTGLVRSMWQRSYNKIVLRFGHIEDKIS